MDVRKKLENKRSLPLFPAIWFKRGMLTHFIICLCVFLFSVTAGASVPETKPSLLLFHQSVGKTVAREPISLGGFSGLAFLGANPKTHRLRFLTHTDRGPNAEPIENTQNHHSLRPFALPQFHPFLVEWEFDPQTSQAYFIRRILLTNTHGKPLTGLPNLAFPIDEDPIDLKGKSLALDPHGLDLEGICVAKDGSYWMADEYGPSIVHFSKEGRLLERHLPKNLQKQRPHLKTDIYSLPEHYSHRQINRGFEAIALDNDKIWVILQSPLQTEKNTRKTRILEFNWVQKKVTGEYLYAFETPASDKIGDATIHPLTHQLVVLEHDGKGGQQRVFEVNLAGATNLQTQVNAEPIAVHKKILLDFSQHPLPQAKKLEGLAFTDSQTLLLLNDNDFGLAGTFDAHSGKLTPLLNPEPNQIFITKIEPAKY